MTYLEDIKKVQSFKYSENGAAALNTSGNYLVDAFALCGSMRYRSPETILGLYNKALIEDGLLATKLAYYTRDVRKGLGERKTGRLLLCHLAYNYPKTFVSNLSLMIEIGRYDDLVEIYCALEGNGIACDAIIELIQKLLLEDRQNALKGKSISLLAKWLPSINTSSKKTRQKAQMIIQALGMTERIYRKMLSELRAYLNVLEVNMTSKDYGSIDYERVPSKAMKKHYEAFYRNDNDRFEEFIKDVKEGKKEIKASALYPYDIVYDYLYNGLTSEVLEEQWKALPNYVDENSNFLIMADVSGSMHGIPMATSVGLALYFAQHNKGTFGNHFMTFSNKPKLVEIKGNTLADKIEYIQSVDWEMNTHLEAAFRLVLETAVKNNTPQEEFPTSIVVISDMEIDTCQGYIDKESKNIHDIFSTHMKKKFADAGYQMPNLVFWNVNARHNTFHGGAYDENIQLVSGSSPTVFKNLSKNKFMTPYEFVKATLSDERYKDIVFIEE